MRGSTYRRCYCRDAAGKPLSKACPKLTSRRHGVYAVRQELPPRADGTRRSFSRSGYATVKDAQEVLDKVRALLDLPAKGDQEGQVLVGDLLETVSKDKDAPLPDLAETRRRLVREQELHSTMTVGDLLDEWLDVKRKSKRPTTLHGYESHVRVHLRPHLGGRRLETLGVKHCQAMFDAIDEQNETYAAENAARREQEARCRWTKPGRPPAEVRAKLTAERARLAEMPPYRKITGLATKHAVRRTLRTALNFAIGREYVTFNPAKHVELTSSKRPKGLLWTAERVARWRETGEKPSAVMVWTPQQLGAFLDAAEGEPLYAFFHLIAHHGLRRGEGVGVAWEDVAFDSGFLRVSKAITVDGWTPYEADPKTEESAAPVKLDRGTVAVLREHKARQDQQRAERLSAGLPWTDTGKVFVQDDGAWLHPEMVSEAFRRIVREADLPPINLRDLRHGTAALVKAGGGELHDAKVKLRHSTIVLTSDTYLELFEEYEEELAERSAAAVPRARRTAVVDTPAHASLTHEAGNDQAPPVV